MKKEEEVEITECGVADDDDDDDDKNKTTPKKTQRIEAIKSHIFSTNHDLNDFKNAQTHK